MTLTLYELLSASKTCDPKRVVIKDKPGDREYEPVVTAFDESQVEVIRERLRRAA